MVGAKVHDRIGNKDYSVYARQVRAFLPCMIFTSMEGVKVLKAIELFCMLSA